MAGVFYFSIMPTEIEAWSRGIGLRLSSDEFGIIIEMDRARRNGLNNLPSLIEQYDPGQKKPAITADLFDSLFLGKQRGLGYD